MKNAKTTVKGQVLYFSHGGGPLPILGEPSHKAMNAFMKRLPELLHRPEAIVVVSAHWEERVPTVLGSSTPAMFYDYYGFPEESYAIEYPAPGAPKLAEKITSLLKTNQIEAAIDNERGFDHGLYIPLLMMYPDADIPALQLSLQKGLDPGGHLQIGKALGELLAENILLIGSGFSFHNMQAFVWNGQTSDDPENDRFQDWLTDVCTNANHSQQDRENLLKNWAEAPAARYCHPREEHLLPVHVCQGAAGKRAVKIFDDTILGKRAVAFHWT